MTAPVGIRSDALDHLARRFAEEAERIWPTPEGESTLQRQVVAVTEELGEVARAILKRSHAFVRPCILDEVRP